MRTKKSTRKGSILDLFLIFLLIFSILGIVLRYREMKQLSAKNEMREYVVLAVMEAIDPHVVECLQIGEELFTAAGEKWGRVASISRSPAKASLISDGKIVPGVWDGDRKCDLLVEIVFEGSENGGVVLQNGKAAILVGQNWTLYSERTVLLLRFLKVGIWEPKNALLGILSNPVVTFCTKSFRR
ncbi:MAG: DUF4330 family protein [Clostridia bacterium]|nr:DUF4330 family protein [Clostridia bacterium]